MTRANTEIPPFTDPLGEALHLLRLTGTLYCRSELTAPWGVDLPAFEDCMMFHVVTAGQASLKNGALVEVVGRAAEATADASSDDAETQRAAR